MTHPDPSFPVLHGRPDHGWLNDPNGLAFVDGRWHVFFQYNPHAPVHDRICWGHTTSPDLVTWTQQPVAIEPRVGTPDEFGCWSGCLVVDDGVPTLVYSGVDHRRGSAEVLLARGDASDPDLVRWQQTGVPVAPRPQDAGTTDVRDPFVLEVDGRRYAVEGAGGTGGRATVLVHDCTDLERWVPLGALVSTDDPVAGAVAPADVWECPSLVRVDGRWVLVVSVLTPGPTAADDVTGVRYLLGDLAVTPDGPRFTARSGGVLDAGWAFYAPQLLAAPGRVLLWGWVREDRAADDVLAAGWAGVLTHPRELAVVDDVLVSRPVPELAALRREELPAGEPLRHRSFELLADGPGSLVLARPDGVEQVVATWDGPASCWVDGSLVELHPDGEVPLTVRAYPDAGSTWTVLGAARTWRLGLP